MEFNSNKSHSNDFYFSNQEDGTSAAKRAAATPQSAKKKKKKKEGVGSTYMFFILVIIVSMVVSIYAIMCMNDVLAITKTRSSVTVSFNQTVKDSDEAIDAFADSGLIKCKNFCKFFIKVRDKVFSSNPLGGPFDAGIYYLNGKMGLEGMLTALKGEQGTKETISLTFPEGYTVPDIINKLAENDVCDKNALVSAIQSTEFTYSTVADLKANETIPYRLEGFLFPDTYEFYIGESAASTIKKFLENGDSKYSEKYRNRAKELGLTDYEVITIASIIQREAANNDQMKKISAIIHNRLEDTVNFPTLGCQSTSDYITNKVAPSLTSTSGHTSEYYMTYYNTNNNSTVVGLPAGPICNPGEKAITAALYPSKTDAKFFFHDTKGNLYTATTYSEFKQKVKQYAPYLDA
ncbi:MAG: endolytic transglycosylase MltG [Eubacterium sp.]|nr:endolytic transglycosylase MltG [Eubacterium sp.]